jgi:hypothetical protein
MTAMESVGLSPWYPRQSPTSAHWTFVSTLCNSKQRNHTMPDTFDPDSFMNTHVDAPMATALQSVPEGEYTAMIGDFDSTAFRQVAVTNKTTGLSQDRPVLDVPFVIQDDALKAKLQREQVTHRETFWLDLTADGRLDTGPDRNVRLGQLRAALGQNVAGMPWSPSMLRNMGPVRIVIKQTVDKQDPDKKYTNITKYAKIS